MWQEFQSMQEHLVQEQIEPVIYEYLLVQMTLSKCHVIEDKLQSLQPERHKKILDMSFEDIINTKINNFII